MLLRCLPRSLPFFSSVILKSRLISIQGQNIKGQHPLNPVKNTITCVHQLLWLVNMQGKNNSSYKYQWYICTHKQKGFDNECFDYSSVVDQLVWLTTSNWRHQNLNTPKMHGFIRSYSGKRNLSFLFVGGTVGAGRWVDILERFQQQHTHKHLLLKCLLSLFLRDLSGTVNVRGVRLGLYPKTSSLFMGKDRQGDRKPWCSLLSATARHTSMEETHLIQSWALWAQSERISRSQADCEPR